MRTVFESESKMRSIRNSKTILRTLIVLSGLLSPSVLSASNESMGLWKTLKGDFTRLSDRGRLLRTGSVLGACGIIANTSIDRDLQSRYQSHMRSSGSDEWAKAAKIFGEGPYLVPASLVAASMGCVFESPQIVTHIGQWGWLTARAYLIGSPVVLCMQRLTGGSRPGETDHDSSWRPLKDDNGVSGHAFIGAVPFLTIARMNRDHAALRYTFCILSALPAWSRVNDSKHYPSQAIAGWYLAWEATDAVFNSRKDEKLASISPVIGQDLFGVSCVLVW